MSGRDGVPAGVRGYGVPETATVHSAPKCEGTVANLMLWKRRDGAGGASESGAQVGDAAETFAVNDAGRLLLGALRAPLSRCSIATARTVGDGPLASSVRHVLCVSG